MINYDAKQNVIKLDNGSINFVIYINQEGYLETIYFRSEERRVGKECM